jgi:hypothetical protein
MIAYRMLRKKFGTEQNDNNRRLQKLSNEKLYNLTSSPVQTDIYDELMYFVWKTRESVEKFNHGKCQSGDNIWSLDTCREFRNMG